MIACQWQDWATGLTHILENSTRITDAMKLIYDQGYGDAREFLLRERGITIPVSSE